MPFDNANRDDTATSDRMVPGLVFRGLDGDAAANAMVATQEREVRLASGRPRGVKKPVARTRLLFAPAPWWTNNVRRLMRSCHAANDAAGQPDPGDLALC